MPGRPDARSLLAEGGGFGRGVYGGAALTGTAPGAILPTLRGGAARPFGPVRDRGDGEGRGGRVRVDHRHVAAAERARDGRLGGAAGPRAGAG
ncbi:hypothetical protein ACWGAN_14285 [Streptomyces sp. NPDC054945]